MFNQSSTTTTTFKSTGPYPSTLFMEVLCFATKYNSNTWPRGNILRRTLHQTDQLSIFNNLIDQNSSTLHAITSNCKKVAEMQCRGIQIWKWTPTCPACTCVCRPTAALSGRCSRFYCGSLLSLGPRRAGSCLCIQEVSWILVTSPDFTRIHRIALNLINSIDVQRNCINIQSVNVLSNLPHRHRWQGGWSTTSAQTRVLKTSR